jgi:cytochrome c oxidase subunit 2
MLSAHFPGLYSADWKVPILMVVIIALMAVKHLMNTRYHFKGWLACIFGVLLLAATLIAVFLKQTSAAGTTGDPAVAAGRKVFNSLACGACHMQAAGQIAPALEGVYGSLRDLTDGSKVLADEPYLRRSILEPQVEVVKGYAPAMPSFAGRISEPELEDLLDYIRSLRGAPGGR